jgi:organic radical activating enzyme
MYKTCKDLENSLYVAPNEIRACCKRFFFEGKMRGDAKLLNITKNKTPTVEDLRKARQKVFDEIQLNKNEDCKQCVFLKEVKDKPKFTSNISYLSIEHHSVCNLRCTYCSEIYWGGKRSKYNVVEFISYLSENNSFKDCDQVVWGGGEPTLDKSFEQILEAIHKRANPKIYHRVFTNSVRYSEAITKFLKLGLIKIVTSVDAGTAETFLKIRGRKKFLNVFENLRKYSEIDPTKITVKYIFTEENCSEKELDLFVENCIKNKLSNCNFQLSLNFKKKSLEFEILKSITYLFFKLSYNGFKKIFLDDHITMRFNSLTKEELKKIKNYLIKKNAEKILLDPYKIKNLVIYGAGTIATDIIKKTNFFKQMQIKNYDIVDSDEKKIGKLFFDKKIQPPSFLEKDDRFIFIATALGYDEVFKKIINIKGNSEKIVNGLIL